MKKRRFSNKDILGYLKDRENTVVPYSQIMETFDLTRLTIHKKIVALQDDGELIAPICYVTPGKHKGKTWIPPHFGGGMMLFNPDIADDDVRDLVQESCKWFLSLHRGIVRLADVVWNKPKIRTILIPAQGREIKRIAVAS